MKIENLHPSLEPFRELLEEPVPRGSERVLPAELALAAYKLKFVHKRELSFLEAVRENKHLTPRQAAWVKRIFSRVRQQRKLIVSEKELLELREASQKLAVIKLLDKYRGEVLDAKNVLEMTDMLINGIFYGESRNAFLPNPFIDMEES